MSQWVGAHPYGDRLQSDSSTLSIEPSTVIMADASFVCGMVSRCDSVQEPPGSGLLDCLTTAHRLDSAAGSVSSETRIRIDRAAVHTPVPVRLLYLSTQVLDY